MKKAIGFVVLVAVLALAVWGQHKPSYSIESCKSCESVFRSDHCSEVRQLLVGKDSDVVEAVCVRMNTPHRWASDLLKEKRSDGCRWDDTFFGRLTLLCPNPKYWSDHSMIVGTLEPQEIVKESIRLDWCIEHGETRVLREGR